jgi:hypothetical protein
MKTLMLAAVAAVTLAACSGPTVNGGNETAALPGEPHVVMPVGPYDNTANSLGGRNAGNYGGN